jgi:CMP-N-acetylneuraminic acid synthetase|tara:strand:- start:2819 stop:3490 length:672 start_codon:yes stop_codon:yes gene_type:complete
MKVVAFVPMRHQSERVPGKNYREFDGRPLFHHIAATLLACPEVERIVIDTDSPAVAEQCAEHFPDVFVIGRPDHLLGGEVPMTEILRHDASLVDADWYLQAHSTSPLLRSSTVSAALAELGSRLDEFDSLFSVTRLQSRLFDSDWRPMNHDPSVLLRTQDLPPVYEENSGLYVFSREQIAEGRRFGDRPLLFEIEPLEAIDIDEEADFLLAESLHRLQREGRL